MPLNDSCFTEIEKTLSPEQKALLSTFVEELTAWNNHMNLTGLSSPRRIMDELVADSLMPLPYLPDTGICLDVGSGAGFPAIPLKICRPAMNFFLMEPNLKKGSFLKQIIRLCGLKQIEVIRARIETLSPPLPFERCHVITSRAMAPLPKLIGWCAPYLAPGGLMVAFLGNRFEDILAECEPLLKEKGLFVHDSKPYMLKGKELKRNLLILKKRT
ncbi:MAG: 16S rRNA (guanine(527)-N(7))-methyltransferase RsmG [Deltaproteobacteria bacterium]|nr:16S rRNA (guanine(527)-N(7))-methyltransferase RsmG [Deltaproteobacteria bacterium]